MLILALAVGSCVASTPAVPGGSNPLRVPFQFAVPGENFTVSNVMLSRKAAFSQECMQFVSAVARIRRKAMSQNEKTYKPDFEKKVRAMCQDKHQDRSTLGLLNC